VGDARTGAVGRTILTRLVIGVDEHGVDTNSTEPHAIWEDFRYWLISAA
jgi:hypothetical protein